MKILYYVKHDDVEDLLCEALINRADGGEMALRAAAKVRGAERFPSRQRKRWTRSPHASPAGAARRGRMGAHQGVRMNAHLHRMILAGVLIIGGAGLYYFGGKYLWPAPDRNAIQTVGIIEAPEVNISSRIGRRITSLPLLEGDVVEAGQVVCRIEDVDIRNQLAKARADLADAGAELADAERTLQRYRILFSKNVISVQARDDAATRVDKDRAAVQSARANVQYYQDQLTDTQIRSSISGVVVSKNLEVGEWANPGTAILTVDDLSTIWARVDLEETQLGFIKVGSPAQVTLPTQPPTMLSGQVMAIGQEGEFATETDVRRGRQDIRTFYVKVRLLRPGGIAKPGMTAEVTFRRPNALQLRRSRRSAGTHTRSAFRRGRATEVLVKKSWAVMQRDLIKLYKTPALIIASVVMPILFLVIFGNSLEGQLRHLPLVIVSQDQGPYAQRVIEEMQALAAGPKIITVTYMNDPGRAIQEVRNGRFKAALIIPPHFSRDITVGRIAELGLFTDNVDSISSTTLQGLIGQATAVIRNGFVTAREPKFDQIVLRPSNLFATVDYDRSLIPGVIVMALFMGSMTSGVFNWIMDRFSGVTEAYLVTPLSPWNIAGGILASSVVATTCEAILVLIAGLALTGGGLAGGISAMAMLCGVIILTGTGLLAMMFAMYSRASNPRLIGGPTGFLNVILFFPSGAIYPIESLPPWLRAFTRWNPETHAISALKSVMFKGANFAAISGDVAFLAVFTAIMLMLAGVTLKRSL